MERDKETERQTRKEGVKEEGREQKERKTEGRKKALLALVYILDLTESKLQVT